MGNKVKDKNTKEIWRAELKINVLHTDMVVCFIPVSKWLLPQRPQISSLLSCLSCLAPTSVYSPIYQLKGNEWDGSGQPGSHSSAVPSIHSYPSLPCHTGLICSILPLHNCRGMDVFTEWVCDPVIFLGPCCAACRILVPDQGLNLGPQQWKRWVLTTES